MGTPATKSPFGLLLVELCKRAGLTPFEAGNKAKIQGRSTMTYAVRSHRTGKRHGLLTIDQIRALCEVLGCSQQETTQLVVLGALEYAPAVLWISLIIVALGGCLGEWFRLRRRWARGIAASYGHAAVLCALIIGGNATLAGILAAESPSSLPMLIIVLVVGGGPFLYAAAWIVAVTSWDYFQQSLAQVRVRKKSRTRP